MPRLSMRCYAVFDTVAEVLVGSVMLAHNDAAASRAFSAGVLNPQAQLGNSPEDFRLLLLGEITDFGVITPFDPSVVITGREVIERARGGADS